MVYNLLTIGMVAFCVVMLAYLAVGIRDMRRETAIRKAKIASGLPTDLQAVRELFTQYQILAVKQLEGNDFVRVWDLLRHADANILRAADKLAFVQAGVHWPYFEVDEVSKVEAAIAKANDWMQQVVELCDELTSAAAQ